MAVLTDWQLAASWAAMLAHSMVDPRACLCRLPSWGSSSQALPWVYRWAGLREMSRAARTVVRKASRTVVHLVEPKALKSAVLKGGQKAAKMAGSTASWKAVLRAALLDLWVD